MTSALVTLHRFSPAPGGSAAAPAGGVSGGGSVGGVVAGGAIGAGSVGASAAMSPLDSPEGTGVCSSPGWGVVSSSMSLLPEPCRFGHVLSRTSGAGMRFPTDGSPLPVADRFGRAVDRRRAPAVSVRTLRAMAVTTVALIPVAAAPEGDPYRRITVAPVAGACGAVVDGVDLAADLDDDVVAEIRRALLDHHVVFFRGQRLTPERQVGFSRRFGPYSPVPFIEPVAGHPEVIAVVREADEQQRYTFGSLWHSDFSFLPEPPFASILHALEVPPSGGDTIWANQ